MKRKTLFFLSLVTLGVVLIYSFANPKRVYQNINDQNVLPLLKHLPSDAERGNVPAKDGRFLYDLIVQKGYKHGLEVGTSNGYSALWQGLALKMNNGTLVTIEIDSVIAMEALYNFRKAGLDNLIDLRINDANAELKTLDDSFDFVFIDAGDYNPEFLNLSYPLVKKGGTLVVHNVNKSDSRIKNILEKPGLDTKFKSRLFYKILICTRN